MDSSPLDHLVAPVYLQSPFSLTMPKRELITRRWRLYVSQANSGVLQEVVNQGSFLHTGIHSRHPLSSPQQPISIIPQSGSLTQAYQQLQNLLHSFNQRFSVHPTIFRHSPNSHFSPFSNSSPSDGQHSQEHNPPNSPQIPSGILTRQDSPFS